MPETPGPRRPTHRDIARLAGISQATVSLVLNNRDTVVGISPATRESVLAAAKQLGYMPNLGVRRLRNAASAAVAPELTLAILRPSGTPVTLTARLIEAAGAGLAAHSPSSQLVVEEYQPGRLAEHPGITVLARFHGAIVTSPTPQDEAFLEEASLPLPVVVFQRHLQRQACVAVDNMRGGELATQHLLARGRRRIAIAGWSSVPSRAVTDRIEGYRRALDAAGLAESAAVEWASELSEAGGVAAGDALLRRQAAGRPDAILALSDVMALGVLHAARRAGLRVPEDVAVVGYDDLPFASYLAPPLTTVRLPYETMGRAAVDWLVGAIRGRASSRLCALYQPQLIVRESA